MIRISAWQTVHPTYAIWPHYVAVVTDDVLDRSATMSISQAEFEQNKLDPAAILNLIGTHVELALASIGAK